MASFDIVSEANVQEIENAINTAKKELATRYDFRGSKYEVNWDKKEITFLAEDDYKMNAIKEIIQSKAIKRGLDPRIIKFDKHEPAGGMMLRQKATIVQGIDKEKSKEITKQIKDSKLKVQVQIQGETLRVTSKSIDELQECMAFIRGKDFGVPLQFNNMRS
jgi:cyclic-di-GMP-binding protein